MGRLLILAVLVLAGVWLVRRALSRIEGGEEAQRSSKPVEDLVRCAHCGVLLPRAEARDAGGAMYCGDEHARRGPGPR